MLTAPLIAALVAGAFVTPVNDDLGTTRTYRVEQTVHLDGIAKDAKSVRWWVAIPDDHYDQDVLDFSVVSAPGTWRIERDADRGNRFLYIEVEKPGAESLTAQVAFTLRRSPLLAKVDPATVGPITDVHRGMYAEYLVKDAPHMKVTPAIQETADATCGDEQNPFLQAQALLGHVAEVADHYSKDPTKPHCGIGDAEDCMTNGGGCCTDLHSLFIALARARGIPSRLQMGYRLNPKNEGKDYDPGYRCWVEYFVPGHGWVSSDIVEADAPGGQGAARWFTGLTEWRLWLNEGREFRLRPDENAAPVNTMIIGHAVIDGKVARVLPVEPLPAQHRRTIRYEQVR